MSTFTTHIKTMMEAFGLKYKKLNTTSPIGKGKK
jgi:hypothetical protein